MRLLLEVVRASDNRIEGRIGTDVGGSADNWRAFSGVLELLKELEDLA